MTRKEELRPNPFDKIEQSKRYDIISRIDELIKGETRLADSEPRLYVLPDDARSNIPFANPAAWQEHRDSVRTYDDKLVIALYSTTHPGSLLKIVTSMNMFAAKQWACYSIWIVGDHLPVVIDKISRWDLDIMPEDTINFDQEADCLPLLLVRGPSTKTEEIEFERLIAHIKQQETVRAREFITDPTFFLNHYNRQPMIVPQRLMTNGEMVAYTKILAERMGLNSQGFTVGRKGYQNYQEVRVVELGKYQSDLNLRGLALITYQLNEYGHSLWQKATRVALPIVSRGRRIGWTILREHYDKDANVIDTQFGHGAHEVHFLRT